MILANNVNYFAATKLTLPPAFSTASTADLEAESTVMLMLLVTAPRASKRMPSNCLETTLEFNKD